jgi:anti-anti-sigma regulatory factor
MSETAALPAPETTVVVCTGAYDIACRWQFRADLEPLAHVTNAILDFTDVTYVDSTIVGELIRLHRIRAEAGYDGETVAIHAPNIRKLFKLLQLNFVMKCLTQRRAA